MFRKYLHSTKEVKKGEKEKHQSLSKIIRVPYFPAA